MNNKIKGAAAAAAAGVLLLGGYGTMAQWSDNAAMNGGTVTAGELKLSAATPGTWTDVTVANTPVPIPAIGDFDVVPGDVLTYESSATISAVGDNLEATLVADKASITGDLALQDAMGITTVVTVDDDPATIEVGDEAVVSEITDLHNGRTAKVRVTFTFDASATDASQLQTLTLEAFKLALTQS